MTRTRQLSGRAKSRYLRQVVEQVGAGPNVSATLDAAIVKIWVQGAGAVHLGIGRPAGTRRIRPKAVAAPTETVPAGAVPAATAPNPKTTAAEPAVSFNPYGFSAMAVLLNEGRPALEALLSKATSREQIVQLAEAQSVRLDPAVVANKRTSLKAMRTAFADAVEKRIAHRRAVSG